jgi:hypothetical protein
MFTLEQKIFIMQCYFRNGERLENGEWSYSTHRIFQEFQYKFPRKSTNASTCFWKQVVFCAKKTMDDRQKKQLKILKRLNKEFWRDSK